MLCLNSLSGHPLEVMVSRPTAHLVDLVVHPNGVSEVLMVNRQLMIISTVGHILLIINLMHIHHMEVILNIWLQEAAMVLVGSKDLTTVCRGHPHTVAVTITMEGKGVIYPMLLHPPSFPVQSPHMALVLPQLR